MKKPNILLITSDQQHWNTIGSFNSEIHTPHLDRLVKEGTTFSRAYCPNPTCTPTRASIITGMYPSQHGAWTLGTKLQEDRHTVGDDFISQGYKTSLVGKAHFQPLASTDEYQSLECFPVLQDLDYWRNFNERFYGFEHIEITRNHTISPHVGQHYAIWLEEKGCLNWRDYFLPHNENEQKRNFGYTWDIPEELHYDNWIAERTNALLEQHKEKDESFFLWASFFDPHPAYAVPEPWDTMYDPENLTVKQPVAGEHDDSPPFLQMTQQQDPDFSEFIESGFSLHGFRSHLTDTDKLKKDLAVYYGMISMMDKYIGKILNKLDELHLSEDTIVVFATDHGHLLGHHGLIAKGPFPYEDLIKIPMIVRYPGHVPANHVSSSFQSLVDLAPTFLSFSGIPIPSFMTGRDQSQVWLGQSEQVRDHIICEFRHEPTTIHLKTYVEDRYKITIYYNREYGEIYDLHEDPDELSNLWDVPEYKDLKSRLLLKYAWAELGKEPIWMPRISGA